MKNQLTNIALEGTCSGDVVGGLLSWTVENLQALLLLKGEKPSAGKRTGYPGDGKADERLNHQPGPG